MEAFYSVCGMTPKAPLAQTTVYCYLRLYDSFSLNQMQIAKEDFFGL